MHVAAVYYAQGQYTEAARLSPRALVLHEAVLGPDHPQLVPVLEAHAALSRITLPDEACDFVDVDLIKGQKFVWAVDVPLWAAEEGRSDLTLSFTVSGSQDGVRLEIEDLHAL
jgi:tetratricopeptide repeat protein